MLPPAGGACKLHTHKPPAAARSLRPPLLRLHVLLQDELLKHAALLSGKAPRALTLAVHSFRKKKKHFIVDAEAQSQHTRTRTQTRIQTQVCFLWFDFSVLAARLA